MTTTLDDVMTELRAMREEQSQLRHGQDAMREEQSQLRHGQDAMREEQSQLRHGQDAMREEQSQLRQEHRQLRDEMQEGFDRVELKIQKVRTDIHNLDKDLDKHMGVHRELEAEIAALKSAKATRVSPSSRARR